MEKPSSLKQADNAPDWYMNVVPLVSLYLSTKYDMHIRGLENIPYEPAMFVANHLRFDDSLIMAAVFANYMKSPLRLGAKSEYFEGLGTDNKGHHGRAVKLFVDKTQQIPVYREDNIRGAASLSRDIKRRIELGESVALHAEGTRSEDGRLNKFKRGAAAIAIKNNISIVPVALTYTPSGKRFRRDSATIEFGEPLMPKLYGMDVHHYPIVPNRLMDALAPRVMKQSERIDLVSDIIEARVAEMSGQEQSGIYLDPYNKEVTAEPEQ